MRKIISPGEEAKKRKRNQTILVIFLGFVMIASTIGFAIQSGIGNSPSGSSGFETEAEYNSYKFINQNSLWVLGNFVFKYLPGEVPNIDAQVKDATNYQGKPAYVYSEDEEAEIEIAVNIGQLAQRIQKACPKGISCQDGLPVKTCDDNFIIIKESNTTAITQENNCIFIEGRKSELTKLSDQFLFKTLGIK